MKGIRSIIAIVLMHTCSSAAMCQSVQESKFFINNLQVDLNKMFFNPSRMDSLIVVKKEAVGEVHIYTKNSEFTSCSLKEIVEKYAKQIAENDTVLFRIDGKLINDTTSVRIDDSYYIYVEVEELNNVKYLPNNFLSIKIISIDLESKKREPKIYLRGNEEILKRIESN